jgi:deoxyribonuclease-4
VLLEDTAGAGTTMGTTFSELGAIIDGLSDASRVGICFDTCHAFAAGYELRTPEGLAETLEEFDREIGLDRLCLIHLNDSKFPLGSRRDRHAHIGYGEIGEEAFSLIVNHPALRDLPFILETPKEIDGNLHADKINLAQVRSLRRG